MSLLNMLGEKYTKYALNDYVIPKPIRLQPYFDVQMELISKYRDVHENVELIKKLVDEFDGKPDIFFGEVAKATYEITNDVTEKITLSHRKAIKNNYSIDVFNSFKAKHPKKIHITENCGPILIRLDIRKACYNVLKHFTGIFSGYPNFHRYIMSFSEYDDPVLSYIANSKRIRNIIFGHVADRGNVIIRLEKYLIGTILSMLNTQQTLIYKGHDEIVFEYNESIENELQRVVDTLGVSDIIRFEQFTIKETEYGFVEQHGDEIVLKTVHSHFFCEALAKELGEPLHKAYQYFEYNGYVCKRVQAV